MLQWSHPVHNLLRPTETFRLVLSSLPLKNNLFSYFYIFPQRVNRWGDRSNGTRSRYILTDKIHGIMRCMLWVGTRLPDTRAGEDTRDR